MQISLNHCSDHDIKTFHGETPYRRRANTEGNPLGMRGEKERADLRCCQHYRRGLEGERYWEEGGLVPNMGGGEESKRAADIPSNAAALSSSPLPQPFPRHASSSSSQSLFLRCWPCERMCAPPLSLSFLTFSPSISSSAAAQTCQRPGADMKLASSRFLPASWPHFVDPFSSVFCASKRAVAYIKDCMSCSYNVLKGII